MAYKAIPEIDSRGYEDILNEIAVLAREYAPEWKFSPDEPDAGTALACIFARRTAETIKKFNQTPLNNKRCFYNMLGASALPAVPAAGYVQLKPGALNNGGVFAEEGFRLFSPIIDDQGTRLVFQTTLGVWAVPANISEVVYADDRENLLCFWNDREKPFEPSFRCNSARSFFRFGDSLLGSLNEKCGLYINFLGTDGEKWAEKLSDPSLARFSQISGDSETEISCFSENGRIKIGAVSGCDKINVEIKNTDEFDGLSFNGINLYSEGISLKPDSVFVNGEFEGNGVFYAFGESPSVYDTVYFESLAAFSKKGAVITLAFNIDFDAVNNGEIPEPTIPNKLFVKKSDVRAIERKNVTVESVVWEYWNGTGFAVIRGLEDHEGIFSGVAEDGSYVSRSRYELNFICPNDISEVLVGAAQRLCVRARIKRIKNPYALPSLNFIPKLENVRISYKYDTPVSVTDVKTVSNCEENAGFKKLPNASLYIGLDFPARDFTLLVCDGAPSGCLNSAEWSFLTENGWNIVIPQTKPELSGFFSFSLPRKITESTVFGKKAYWLRAEVPENKKIRLDSLLLNCVPVTQHDDAESFCSDSVIESIRLERKNIISLTIYINISKDRNEEKWEELQSGWTLDKAEGIIRFSPKLTLNPNSRTVKLKYRYGGGSSGNLPAGQDFVPALSDGSVIGAVNPFAISGGCDAENDRDMQLRLAGELRHSNRPVTKRDFEQILTSVNVSSVRVENNSSGGIEIEAMAASGEISSEDIKNEIYGRLRDTLPLGAGKVTIRVVCKDG